MTNRITRLSVTDMRLTPAEAHVWFTVHLERLTSTTQIRGRLMGPSCPYASTIEVAYPLREQSREYEAYGIPQIVLRVLVPEPSFWDPQSPFLYHGPLELWQGDERCETMPLRHGLKDLALGPKGLRWNHRPITLAGQATEACTEAEARRLHEAGYNAWLVPVRPDTAVLWDLADRFGFLILGRIVTREQIRQAHDIGDHASALGWLLAAELLDDPLVTAALPFPARDGQVLGVELHELPTQPLPENFRFIACNVERLSALSSVPLPKLLLGARPDERTGLLGGITPPAIPDR